MQRPSWVTRPLLIIAAAVVVVAGVAVVVFVRRSALPGGVASDKNKMIAVGGGVQLAAEVITPSDASHAPLLVMPASWGSAVSEYHALGLMLAKAGFQVVAYAQAGFGGSSGEIDYAGPQTQREASSVISWALAHTSADASRIGMFGVSYGGGVSLLAAARDSRIKAVVAMSTWSDLAASFDLNHTASVYSLGALLTQAQKTGHLSSEFSAVAKTLAQDPPAAGAAMASLAPPRSPATMIDGLNRNHPAIMLANGFEDSIVEPQQLVDFFAKLTGPKRLELAPGDHGGPEASGLLGASNAVVSTAQSWLAHYLSGTANGIDKQEPISLQDVVTHAWHDYRSWPTSSVAVQLDRPGATGAAAVGAARTWTATIAAGTDTSAVSGPTTVLSPDPYVPPTIAVASVDPAHAFIWNAPVVPSATLVSGTPRLTLTARSSTGSATLFAYLYDVTGDAASLMSVTPFTLHDAAAPKRVSFDLEPTSWTVEAGHHVTLVIDTVDARWHSASTPGSTVSLSSSTAAPATLAVPIPS
jgi:predicted acyl esterase